MSKSILQDWVQALGLRQQGVILTAIRGCDTAPKLDTSKALTRSLRECVLNPHCGDPKDAATFIEWAPPDVIQGRFDAFRKNLDHYPHHYVMHLMHAIEVVGYCHPEPAVRDLWQSFYIKMCQGMHVNHEFPDQMNKRLNADEATFARHDDAAAYPESGKAQGGKTKEGWEQYDPPIGIQACEQSARNERTATWGESMHYAPIQSLTEGAGLVAGYPHAWKVPGEQSARNERATGPIVWTAEQIAQFAAAQGRAVRAEVKARLDDMEKRGLLNMDPASAESARDKAEKEQ